MILSTRNAAHIPPVKLIDKKYEFTFAFRNREMLDKMNNMYKWGDGVGLRGLGYLRGMGVELGEGWNWAENGSLSWP